MATQLLDSPLNTPDADVFDGWMRPDAPLDDAPVRQADGSAAWSLAQVGQGFVLLHFGLPGAAALKAIDALACEAIPVRALVVLPAGEQAPRGAAGVIDSEGLAARRCDAKSGTCYLIRPDQHVAARWRRFDGEAVRAALARATQQETA